MILINLVFLFFIGYLHEKKLRFLITILILSELMLLLLIQFFPGLGIGDFVFNLVNNLIQDENILPWSFSQTYDYFFRERNDFVSPIFGLIASVVIFLSRDKKISLVSFNFLFLLFLLFFPLIAVFRIVYLIYVYNAILSSILLSKIMRYVENRKNNSELSIKHRIRLKRLIISRFERIYSTLIFIFNEIRRLRRKTDSLQVSFPKNFNFFKVVLLLWLSFSPVIIIHSLDSAYPVNAVNEIDDLETGVTYYSTYSYSEFEAAKWLNLNVDDPNATNICSEPASNRILSGLSGVHAIQDYYNDIESFRDIFLTCNENDINVSFFEDIVVRKMKRVLLVITPRMHKWIQTGSLIERSHTSSDWINSTLLLYIENSPSFSNIYQNEEVFVYEYLTNSTLEW